MGKINVGGGGGVKNFIDMGWDNPGMRKVAKIAYGGYLFFRSPYSGDIYFGLQTGTASPGLGRIDPKVSLDTVFTNATHGFNIKDAAKGPVSFDFHPNGDFYTVNSAARPARMTHDLTLLATFNGSYLGTYNGLKYNEAKDILVMLDYSGNTLYIELLDGTTLVKSGGWSADLTANWGLPSSHYWNRMVFSGDKLMIFGNLNYSGASYIILTMNAAWTGVTNTVIGTLGGGANYAREIHTVGSKAYLLDLSSSGAGATLFKFDIASLAAGGTVNAEAQLYFPCRGNVFKTDVTANKFYIATAGNERQEATCARIDLATMTIDYIFDMGYMGGAGSEAASAVAIDDENMFLFKQQLYPGISGARTVMFLVNDKTLKPDELTTIL